MLPSRSPTEVRFSLVKQSAFDVPLHLRKFYQAEVLVPSPISPEFIIFPKECLDLEERLCLFVVSQERQIRKKQKQKAEHRLD